MKFLFCEKGKYLEGLDNWPTKCQFREAKEAAESCVYIGSTQAKSVDKRSF